MKQIAIGHVNDYADFPAEVELDRHPYYLVKSDDSYQLLSRVCPHAGYPVETYNGQLLCPMHFWTFDVKTGVCLNVRGAKLLSWPVEEKDGMLTAIIG